MDADGRILAPGLRSSDGVAYRAYEATVGRRTGNHPRAEPRQDETGDAAKASSASFRVEVLISYSHTTQRADLQRCATAHLTAVVHAPRPVPKRPWSLRDRLDERTRADMIAAYCAGTTAASLANAHALSLRSVKRLLASAGVRRKRLTV